MRPLVEELVPAPDPVVCCERLAGLPYRLFFDSAARGSRLGRYSFLTADPVTSVHSKGAVTTRVDLPDGVPRSVEGDALAVVRDLLAPFASAAVQGLPPFQGGAAGYLAYDWGRVLERLPAPRYDDLGLPDVVLSVYDWVLAWDHDASRAWLVSTGIPETLETARARRARDRAVEVRTRITAERRPEGLRLPLQRAAPVAGDLQVSGPRQAAPSYPIEDADGYSRLALRSSFTHAGYLEAVRHVREYIYAGDIFQANLSQRFQAPLGETPWDLYRRMRLRNAAPFAAYFECPDAAIVSASPERFLRVDADGHVETRPIKGTRPRGVGPEHDGALGQALTESAKDRAENLMIVDLMRNDLSRVCEPGTVRVPELFTLERYATVHHLVSTVVGRLAAGRDAFDLVRATFPGGSITGAPKLRAMEIIAELEPSQRSIYCGSLGYWSVTGVMDTNIAIRTAIAAADRVYFSAGGGIVADSDPEQEYRETLDKARGMIDALDGQRRQRVPADMKEGGQGA
jgi:para-aminobenzoate synthetase component 1